MLPWLPLTWAQSLPNTVSGKISSCYLGYHLPGHSHYLTQFLGRLARVTLVTWAQSLPDMIISGKISSCYLGYHLPGHSHYLTQFLGRLARVTLVTWAQSPLDTFFGKISSCYLGYLGTVTTRHSFWED